MATSVMNTRTLTMDLNVNKLRKGNKVASFVKVNRQSVYVEYAAGGGWMRVIAARKLWKQLRREGWVRIS